MRKLTVPLLVLFAALLSIGCKHRQQPYVPPPNQQLVGAGTYGSAVFYTNMRQAGQFYVLDPVFGAVGDNVHDDTSAFTSAIAKAVAAGGGTVVVSQPPVAYKTTAPVVLLPGVYLMGYASQPGQCEMRAGSSMLAVLEVQNYAAVLAPTPNRISGITLNANSLANYARLDLGVFSTKTDTVFYKGAIIDGQREATATVPLALSSVTAAGGGANSDVTLSQPDTNYHGFLVSGVKSLVIKVVDTGGLNTGTYQMSFDGGGTFQPAKQLIAATSNINLTSGTVFGAPTGVRAAFVSKTYTSGWTYSFTATVAADQFTGHAINADNSCDDCKWAQNGTVFATAGLIGNYTGIGHGAGTTVVGTLATTSGSQIITGTGTSFMSLGAREGDLWLVNSQLFATASVLDDLELAVPSTATPSFSLSGLAYAVGVGDGFEEDDNVENVRWRFHGGQAAQNASSSFRFGGTQGPLVEQTRNEQYGFSAYTWGTIAAVSASSPYFVHPHIESGATGSASIYSYSIVPCGVTEPLEQWVTAGPGGGWEVLQGTFLPWNGGGQTLLPIYTERYASAGATVLTTGAETLTVPGVSSTSGPTLITLNPQSDLVMTAAPLFPGAAALPNGVVIRLINVSGSFSFTLQADPQAATGLVTRNRYALIGPGGYITFQSLSGKLQQIDYEANGGFASPTGNPGDWYAGPITVTTNNTPTKLIDFNVVNAGISSGTTIEYNVVARSNGAANLASWTGCRAMWDTAHTLLASQACTAWGNNAGAPPAGWAVTLGFDGANQFSRILGTGDNTANNVHWKVYVRHMSPPPDILPLVELDAFYEPCLPRRRRAENDNALDFDETIAA